MPILLELHNDHYDVEEDYNLISHVTVHTEYLRYNKYTDATSTHLDYFESEIQSPKKNIKIEDLSQNHAQNNIDLIEGIVEEYSGLSFHSLYKDLLITNIADNEGKPLFYKHKTRWKEAPEITFINENEHSDRGMNSKYIDGYLFNDFDNEYDYDQNSYQLIFLAGTDVNNNQKVELLNNESAIAELSWRDINIDLVDGASDEDILSGEAGTAKVNSYTRTQSGNGYDYRVILVQGFCEEENEGKIFVKFLKSNSIFLEKPSNINQRDSWFLTVNNGAFFTNKKYFVPEYDYQNFNPEYGILKHYDKECYLLNKFNQGSIIKTIKDNVILDPELSLHINVKVLNSSEEVIKVYTSDSELVGENFNNEDLIYEAGVLSVDSQNGVILLEQDIYSNPKAAFEEEIKIRADFYTRAESLVYQKLDVNPTFNPDILEYKYFFYLKPDMDFKESIFWLKVNTENEIKEMSDREFEAEIGREAILAKNLNDFKEDYCYGGNNEYQFLELGEVKYNESAYIDEATILDVRDSTPINEETFEDYLSRQHKVLQSEFGYGPEGQVYQDNNIIYVTAPKTLLQEFNGEYSEPEIYDLLKLKTSPALEILFNWEDKKPEFIIEPLDNEEIGIQDSSEKNEIKLKISFEGPGIYIIYRFEAIQDFQKEGAPSQVRFTKTFNEAEAIEQLDESMFFEYRDELPEYEKVYYYKIIYNDIYDSDIVAFKTRKGSNQ
jgi:hypothetical protein